MIEEAAAKMGVSQARTDTVRCALCGGEARGSWKSSGYRYFACRECEFVRVFPMPQREVLENYYAREYEVDRESHARSQQTRSERDLKVLERIGGKGTLLEVGSSWGYFLDVARRRGWQVKGVELSERASGWAREQLGLDVHYGELESLGKARGGEFDAVVGWHVIEHVPEPMAYLSAVRQVLKPGGFLALRTPNIASLPARVNGSSWQWTGAPAHLSLFSPKSLLKSIERTGFVPRICTTRRGDAHNLLLELIRGGTQKLRIHESVKKRMGIGRAPDPGRAIGRRAGSEANRTKILRRMNKLFDVAFFALLPIERLLELAGLGPEIFLIAQRSD